MGVVYNLQRGGRMVGRLAISTRPLDSSVVHSVSDFRGPDIHTRVREIRASSGAWSRWYRAA